jgi:hypothetical protein
MLRRLAKSSRKIGGRDEVHSGASNLEWYAQHSGSQRWVDAANCELLLLSRSAERDNLILCVNWSGE